MPPTSCVICKSTIDAPVIDKKITAHVLCPLCGQFDITEKIHFGPPLDDSMRHIYSAALREHFLKGNRYVLDDLGYLLASVKVPKNPVDQLDKFLLALSTKSEFFGQLVEFDCHKDYPLAYSKKAEEFHAIIQSAFQRGYVTSSMGWSFPIIAMQLNVEGAVRVAQLQEFDINSDQAFVAMWFDPSMDEAFFDGISPALVDTGYTVMRIKEKEHNNKIDDEIIAEINKSGVLIADFTGHRPSVYFEAGYAKGLGIPVIFTCRKDKIDDAHFDTRQYSHIPWTTPDDLRVKLIQRIEATLPRRINKVLTQS